MKKVFCLLAAFLFMEAICLDALGSSTATNDCLKFFRGKAIEDKVYLHPGMAQICSNGIFVQINGELIMVPSIESDRYGIFISAQYITGKVKSGDWCCIVCWNWNSSNQISCWWCGSDRDD